MRRIYSSFNLVAVHHAKNLLQTEGIRAVVKNEILSSAMGELPPTECQPEVWVLHDADFSKAEEILLRDNQSGADWTCSCGQASGPQFTQCWSCGANRS